MVKVKIFITGGHLSPAVAFIQTLLDEKIPYEIVFIGRKYALEDDTEVSQEFKSIQKFNLKFYALTTGRLRRFISLATIFSLLKIPIGFFQSLYFCYIEKPKLIISFGGYIAVPVVYAGWMLGIPSVTHEQSWSLGLANTLISIVTKKVFLTWPSQKINSKYIVTGLPIRKQIFNPPLKSTFFIPNNKPLLYILGGTTGSVRINNVLWSIIQKLLEDFIIVHQVGNRSEQEAARYRSKLPEHVRKNYIPRQFLDSDDHAFTLHNSLIVISRSGANIVAEIAIMQKVAILIPLSITNREQLKNAEFLHKSGSAEIILDDELTTNMVLECLHKVQTNFNEYSQHAKRLTIQNGTTKMLAEINNIMSSNS